LSLEQLRKLKSLQMGGNDCWYGVLKVALVGFAMALTVGAVEMAPGAEGSCQIGGFEDALSRKGQRSGKWYMLPQCGQGHHSGCALGMCMQSIHVSRWRVSQHREGWLAARVQNLMSYVIQAFKGRERFSEVMILWYPKEF